MQRLPRVAGSRFGNGLSDRRIAATAHLTRDTIEIMTKSKLLRMDNVGIVVESLDDAIAFFTELGLTLEGRAMIEGEWAGRVTGLGDQRVEIAMMVTPDGHSRLELSRFLTPPAVADHRNAPVNALGYLRAIFAAPKDFLSDWQNHLVAIGNG